MVPDGQLMPARCLRKGSLMMKLHDARPCAHRVWPCLEGAFGIITLLAEEQLFNAPMQGREPLVLLTVGEEDVGISTRGNNVKFGVEAVDAIHHPVQARHSEGGV